jgi:hypothetical protein
MVNPRLEFVPAALAPLSLPPSSLAAVQAVQTVLLPQHAEALLRLLLQVTASFPPRPSGSDGLLLCLVGGGGAAPGGSGALGGALLLAAAHGAGLAGNTLALLPDVHFSADGGGSVNTAAASLRVAFPEARVVVGAEAAGKKGCHVVLVDSAEGGSSRARLARARGLALSGARTFLASAECGQEEGAWAFDAAVERGEVNAVSRGKGEQFCAGWVAEAGA